MAWSSVDKPPPDTIYIFFAQAKPEASHCKLRLYSTSEPQDLKRPEHGGLGFTTFEFSIVVHQLFQASNAFLLQQAHQLTYPAVACVTYFGQVLNNPLKGSL